MNDWQDNPRRMLRIMINPDVRLLEVAIVTSVYVDEFLRIAIHQREPAALNLYHDPMALFKSMRHVGHCISDRFDRIWFECLWFFEAVPIFATHDLSAHEHLVSSHRIGNERFFFGVDIGLCI